MTDHLDEATAVEQAFGVEGLVPRRQLVRAKRQRDELLAAAKNALEAAEDLAPELVLDNLRETVERIDRDT